MILTHPRSIGEIIQNFPSGRFVLTQHIRFSLKGEGVRSLLVEGNMESSIRKRHTSALHAPTFISRPRSREADPSLLKTDFHLDLWISLTLQNWILDVGRSIVMLLLPMEWFPSNRPGLADFLHMAYNISAPILLLKLTERSPKTLPRSIIYLCVITVVMGTSIHLVADSITHRLLLIGYQLHLSLRENPIMMNLKPAPLVDSLELLYFYDETLGHFMWYIPLFLIVFLYFSGCFCPREEEPVMPRAGWLLLLPNALYYWYLVTEGQAFILLVFTLFTMVAMTLHQKRKGLVNNSNGLFLLYSFCVSLGLVCVWVACMWSNAELRKKYPRVIYVPQPSAFYTLYLQPKRHQ